MLRPATLVLMGLASAAAIAHALWAPFPASGGNPVLDLIAYHDPGFHTVIRVWYYVAPAVAVLLFGSLGLSVWRVWLQPRAGGGGRGKLPAWPVSPEDEAPSLVVGELHHPTVPRESERPSWLVIPETGLYTGILIVGAVGSGKTSACMYPFAQQLLSWQADWPARRASALVLEVKGDFCHDVRGILEEAGRADDYLEIGLDGSWQWNPLDDPLLDTYSLAYSVASLINQLFGKSREPFWQQAYTNLVRWIIELYRLLPGGWVTLQDVYRCTIDAELFAERIREAKDLVAEACPARVVISHDDMIGHPEALNDWVWIYTSGEDTVTCRLDPVLRDRLAELEIPFETEEGESGAGSELRDQVEAIERWYLNDWMALDAKLRTSIVEGISVFLSLFDQPGVAGVFCPPPPESDESPSIHIGKTALHELGHSTGHPERMNRATLIEGIADGFGSPAYAKEELRAEISAMMTGERVGVGHDPSRGAAYVEGWVAALEEDPREIRRAAADAQKISDFVLARTREREPEREPAAVAATRAPAAQHAARPERPLPVPNRSLGPSR